MTEENQAQNPESCEEPEEEKDVEVLEFSLDEDEIDELIAKLNELKQTKQSFGFDIDGENELLVSYETGGDFEKDFGGEDG